MWDRNPGREWWISDSKIEHWRKSGRQWNDEYWGVSVRWNLAFRSQIGRQSDLSRPSKGKTRLLWHIRLSPVVKRLLAINRSWWIAPSPLNETNLLEERMLKDKCYYLTGNHPSCVDDVGPNENWKDHHWNDCSSVESHGSNVPQPIPERKY